MNLTRALIIQAIIISREHISGDHVAAVAGRVSIAHSPSGVVNVVADNIGHPAVGLEVLYSVSSAVKLILDEIGELAAVIVIELDSVGRKVEIATINH